MSVAGQRGGALQAVDAYTSHDLNDARSLAYHQVIAERVQLHPELVQNAVRRVAEWQSDRSVATYYADHWAQWLALTPPELAAALVATGELANALRQVSPFAGVLTARERWAIWRRTGARVRS